MRRLALLLLLCGTSAAEDKLFLEPGPGDFGSSAAPGWRARIAESLFLLEARLKRDALDAGAYEQAAAVLSLLGRDTDLIERLRKLVKTHFDEPRAKLAPLRRCLGHILVELARGQEPMLQGVKGVFIIRLFGADDDPEKLLKEAIPHLRAVLAHDDKDVRSKEELAYALETLKVEKSEPEVARLRKEAVVHAPKKSEALLPEGADRVAAADTLRNQALALETADKPDFVAAEPLRRRALADDFCTHTIPFEFDDSIFLQISLLAEFSLVNANLTRHYKDKGGEDKWHRCTRAASLQAEQGQRALRRQAEATRPRRGVRPRHQRRRAQVVHEQRRRQAKAEVRDARARRIRSPVLRSVFGMTCRRMIRILVKPRARAAWMNSRSRRPSTSPRTILAVLGH